jgi:hypothetical protein
MKRVVYGLAATTILGPVGCSESGPPPDDFGYSGTGIAVAVAPLDLEGVSDACYSFEIRNGLNQRVVARGRSEDPTGTGVAGQGGDGGPTALEGREANPLCSSRFGDGGGAINYVAPCDASAPAHTVTLWVNAVCEAGTLGGTGSSACVPMYGYQNPCGADGCKVSTTCVENSDVPVRFDFTIMAAAKQGFFDIAVRFDEVFCSAKLDTCYEDGSSINLLFDDSGNEAATAVAAIACTAGTGDVETRVFQTTFKATCDGKTYGLPLAGVSLEGNTHLVELDATGAPVLGGASINAAVYFGTEALINAGRETDANKVFTNIAFVLPTNGKACAVDWWVVPESETACPASENGSTGSFRQVAGVAFRGNVAKGTCAQYALDAAGSAVRTDYLETNGTAAYTSVLVENAQTFAASGCSSTAPPIDACSPTPCLNGGKCTSAPDGFICTCAPGFEGPTCETNTNDCLSNPCLNGGTCADLVLGFTCACAPGFEGPTCEAISGGYFTSFEPFFAAYGMSAENPSIATCSGVRFPTLEDACVCLTASWEEDSFFGTSEVTLSLESVVPFPANYQDWKGGPVVGVCQYYQGGLNGGGPVNAYVFHSTLTEPATPGNFELHLMATDEWANTYYLPTTLDVAAAESAGNATCVIQADDTVSCFEQATGTMSSLAANMPFGLRAKRIAMVGSGFGATTACVIDSEDSLLCWTSNGSTPTQPSLRTNLVDITAGDNHICALDANGVVACAGTMPYGGPLEPATSTGWKALSAGNWHTCGIRASDDTVVCWGRDSDWPHPAPPASQTATQIASGYANLCLIEKDTNDVKCWGGYPGATSFSVPAGLKAKALVHLDGQNVYCALALDNAVSCFGATTGRSVLEVGTTASGLIGTALGLILFP